MQKWILTKCVAIDRFGNACDPIIINMPFFKQPSKCCLFGSSEMKLN